MNNQKHEEMDIVEGNLLKSVEYTRPNESNIIITPLKSNQEFSKSELSIIKYAFNAGNKQKKLGIFFLPQLIVIYEKADKDVRHKL